MVAVNEASMRDRGAGSCIRPVTGVCRPMDRSEVVVSR